MPKLAIFDLDGTLIDSKRMYTDVIYRHIKKHGYSASKKDVESVLGLKMPALLRKLGVKDSERISKEITRDAMRRRTVACPKIGYYRKLHKKFQTCLITNSTREFALLKTRKLGLKFSELYAAEDFRSRTEGLKYIIKKHGLEPRDAVYVADRTDDIRAATRAGCLYLIVRARSFDKERLRKMRGKHIVQDLSKVVQVLNKF